MPKTVLPRHAAPPWRPSRSRYVVLWHGCTGFAKDSIEAAGIQLARCRVDTDFGRGFYTTSVRRQARMWAWDQYYEWLSQNPGKTGNPPVALRFRVPRYGTRAGPGLDRLRSLAFVRGGYASRDYWSLVQHCRRSTPTVVNDHRRPGDWYDLVSGPVAAFWRQRVAMADADQFSFHTDRAVAILNGLLGSRDPARYRWLPV